MEMQRSNFIEIYSYNGLLATRKVIGRKSLILLIFPFNLRTNHYYFKVTRHLCCKNSKNLRPLDILACNSAEKMVY